MLNGISITKRESNRSSENFNMSMCKFFKQVGVTSQQQLEKTARQLPGKTKSMDVKMILTAKGTDLEHVVEGTIELDE
ncbi:MAG: hypothetical protein GY761_19010 [Hyphomicrobiales bacterium]|nr:hypothetical protein [Hyphomicrobiales bacterium]